MSQALGDNIDLSHYTFPDTCDCGKPATVHAKGCMDKQAVSMCDDCLAIGLHRIQLIVTAYQKHNKRVMICGDCYRPILRLDTHLEVRKLTPE